MFMSKHMWYIIISIIAIAKHNLIKILHTNYSWKSKFIRVLNILHTQYEKYFFTEFWNSYIGHIGNQS